MPKNEERLTSPPEAGPMETARAVFNRAVKPCYVAARAQITKALERRAGIRTEGCFTPEELGLSPGNQNRYQPAHWLALRRILSPHDVDSTDVFIDFGSGMGRIVYQAARYPFRRVIGVEVSERLHRIACDNIERNRHRLRCPDVQVVLADAVAYQIPDDVTVAYFYNPFTGPIFASVVEHLVASVARNPRRLRVIYLNPVEERMLLDAGFRKIKRSGGFRPGAEWSRSTSTALYELVG